MDRVHPFPSKKDLSLPPSLQATIKGKSIQTMNASTNRRLSDPYIWHLFSISIHRGPSSPHICHLLSSHLWYRYLKIEICCTFYCVWLLLPSWLIHPNNSFKAFIHFLELGQIVMQFILEKFSSFFKNIHQTRGILGNVHLMFIFGCCR